jgi:hypothetical protein
MRHSPDRRRLVVIAIVCSIVFVAAMAVRRPPVASGAVVGPADRVVVVGVPGLTFTDVLSGPMPALRAAADSGGSAAVTARLAGKSPTTADLYASIGAGSEAATPAKFGMTRPGAALSITVADAGAARAKNKAAHRSSLPGALGDALAGSGVGVAAIGNSDSPGPGRKAAENSRPVAAALMQRDGLVPYAVVERRPLLLNDASAPAGLRADATLISRQVTTALLTQRVVFVETGDLDRLAALQPTASTALESRHRDAALAEVDATISTLSSQAPAETLLLVVGLDPGPVRRLTPMVALGPGVHRGLLSSSSTGRRGVIALADLAPTILHAVAGPVPAGMIGQPLRSSNGSPDLGDMADLDRDARASERLRGPVTNGLVVAIVLFVILGVLTLSRLGRPRRTAPGLEWVALVVASAPLATFLAGWARAGPLAGWVGLAVAAAAVLIAVMAQWLLPRPIDAFLAIEAATLFVLLVDICTGSRLQGASALGNSLLVAARFRGIGNAGLGVVGAATVLVGVAMVERRREARPLVAALFLVVVLVVCLPPLGAKVGGVFVLVPVLAGVLAALAERRFSWRLGVACVALGAAVAVDAVRPASSRSHLGRLVGGTADGSASVATVVSRKLSSAVHVTRTSHWMPAAVALTVLLILALWRFGAWRRLGETASPFHVAVSGVAAVAVLGLVTSDSGILTAALALTAGAAYVVLRVLDEPRGPDPQPPP